MTGTLKYWYKKLFKSTYGRYEVPLLKHSGLSFWNEVRDIFFCFKTNCSEIFTEHWRYARWRCHNFLSEVKDMWYCFHTH
jgi:hypothetical protein